MATYNNYFSLFLFMGLLLSVTYLLTVLFGWTVDRASGL